MRVKNKAAKSTSRPAKGKNAIGYGKPPTHSRFKPGKSGNPSGRPLGSLNRLPAFGSEQMNNIVRQELYRDVEVIDGKRKTTMPAFTAIVQKQVGKAMADDSRAAQMLIEMGLRLECEEKKEYDRFFSHAMVYLQLWGEFIEHAKRFNQPIPKLSPALEQFVMDENGLLTIKGPLTGEAESETSEDGLPIYSSAVARWFLATMKLPPGKDIRHYIEK